MLLLWEEGSHTILKQMKLCSQNIVVLQWILSFFWSLIQWHQIDFDFFVMKRNKMLSTLWSEIEIFCTIWIYLASSTAKIYGFMFWHLTRTVIYGFEEILWMCLFKLFFSDPFFWCHAKPLKQKGEIKI